MQAELCTIEGVRVSRPVKLAEMRIKGFDESVKAEEIANELAKVGGCGPNDITVGRLRMAQRGLGVAWVRCPLTAANKVADLGRITVEWSQCRAELLDVRPLQCFRCLEKGHVREKCSSLIDRSDCCYNCGGKGHRAKDCREPPRCPICKDLGRPANHRVGSAKCTPPNRRPQAGRGERTGGKEQSTPQVSTPRASQVAIASAPLTSAAPSQKPLGGETPMEVVVDEPPKPQRRPPVSERGGIKRTEDGLERP